MAKVTKIKRADWQEVSRWPAQHPDPEADRAIRLAHCVAGNGGPAAFLSQEATLRWAKAVLAEAGEVRFV